MTERRKAAALCNSLVCLFVVGVQKNKVEELEWHHAKSE